MALSNQANWDLSLGQVSFYVSHRILAEMKDTGGEDGVGSAFEQHGGHMLQRAGASTGNHRNSDAFANATGDRNVEPGLGAIGIDTIQNNFTRAQRHRPLSPLHRVQPGWLASAV